jgi:hypothetical protein
MRLVIVILLLAIVVGISPVLAAPVDPYTGVMQNYTNTNGTVPVQILVNVPISAEDVVYPEWLFVMMGLIGSAFLLYSAHLVARSDTIPSMSLIYCGVIALGIFSAMSVMSALVGYTSVFSSIENETVYITQTAVFTLSPWVAWACRGFALAGFVVMIAGVMSYFGWLKRKGIGAAQKGDYLETDGDAVDEETYKMSAQKENANRRKGDKPR